MSKSVGIIGNTGRMGRILMNAISKNQKFSNGIGFSRFQSPYVSLGEVFRQNDYVVDFSTPGLIKDVLKAAIDQTKPLVICTTGWLHEEMQGLLTSLSQKIPLVIASNTSVGAYLQRYLVRQLAKVLGEEYDIDIIEKHHRNKIDSPSGTAMSLLEDIQAAKRQYHKLSYQTYPLEKGPRPEHFIGMAVERTGNIPGDHEVSFTSIEEMICIKHVAFNRALFAKGAIRIVDWLDTTKPQPGIYTMENVLNLV